VIADLLGHIDELFPIVPELIEGVEELAGHRLAGKLRDEIREGLSLLIAKIHGGEPLEAEVDRVFAGPTLEAGELLHRSLRGVRSKRCFAPNPIGTIAGDGALGQLVAELDLKLGAVETAFPFELGDEDLPPFLGQLVGGLAVREGRGGEYELDGLDHLQLFPQRLIGKHRKARCGDPESDSWLDGRPETVAE
jgi:hypothetical protein